MSSPANILDSGSAQKEVLLIYPGKFRAPDPQVPLSLLHLAPPLQLAGYKVRIFDMRVEDIRQLYVGSPVYAGISCMSGLQIRYSLEAARKVRAQNPAVPLVWGGVHPSLLPKQTAANPYVDVAVRGEGETVVAKLADALAAGLPLKSVKGLTFKADGEVRCTPDAELVDLDQIPRGTTL